MYDGEVMILLMSACVCAAEGRVLDSQEKSVSAKAEKHVDFIPSFLAT